MRNRFSDLSAKSLATLMPYINFWSLGEGIDMSASINDELPIETSGIMHVSQYAIFYAVLLDDQELLDDLCRLQADLELRDTFHGEKKTPLELGVEYGRAGIVDSLIRHGATIPDNINVPASSLCAAPLRFFCVLNERLHGRDANYKAIDTLLHHKKFQ